MLPLRSTSNHNLNPDSHFLASFISVIVGGDLSRGLRTPNVLEESITLGKSVQGIVALGSRSHESAESIDLVLAGISAVLIDLADADLRAGVVLGADDAVGCAAFAGDVAISLSLATLSSFPIFQSEREFDVVSLDRLG